ncbi:MAG: hypothetical protein DMF77_14895 [Acidobacteria bacterium]|nr:MAG: hypothetical protein DMF77_14895 [Acidobacteriota bacterium]
MNRHSATLVHASLLVSALIGVACGSDARTPTAAATPAPVSTPTPAPAATPHHLPAIVDLHNHCPKLDSQLLSYVNNAIDTVQQKHPELFDFSDARGESVKVLDRQKYQTAVVASINGQGGVCAKDDDEEVAVKVSNDFNEQFNIWTSAGYTRRSYITTCFPAQF